MPSQKGERRDKGSRGRAKQAAGAASAAARRCQSRRGGEISRLGRNFSVAGGFDFPPCWSRRLNTRDAQRLPLLLYKRGKRARKKITQPFLLIQEVCLLRQITLCQAWQDTQLLGMPLLPGSNRTGKCRPPTPALEGCAC